MIFLPLIDNGMGLCRMDYTGSLLNAMSGRDFEWTRVGYPYPEGARNIATHEFLESKCDRMLMIDGDMVFTREHVNMILSHDVPIVGGVYCKKKLGLHLVLDSDSVFSKTPMAANVNPLVEVNWTGTGFMMIHRSVFEKMKPNAPECEMEGMRMNAFWRNELGGHGEDVNFCNAWRALGGKVFVDQRCTLQHEGHAVYPIPGTFQHAA